MAKRRYTKEEIVAFIKDLDTRAVKLSDTKIDNIIDRAYSELMTISKSLFSDEEVLDLAPYYESDEGKITVQINRDVTYVYDLYVTLEGEHKLKDACDDIINEIGLCRNPEIIKRDNRNNDIVHIYLDYIDDTRFDNAVIKYFYTPISTQDDIFMDSQVYIAFQDALGTSLNYFLKDVETENQKRNSMNRTARAAVQEPNDTPEPVRAVFDF